ncbi:hypothetical protein Ntsu_65270 [Nocardia sp. IFM 10818]
MFAGRLTWVADNDPHASKLLYRYHPEIPNLGDITQIDWSQVAPVDILTAGYPCQPFSVAGLHKGENDPRHLWPYVRTAIAHLRPRYAVLENVPGHVRRGFSEVLGDLAEIGFDARWACVPAADVGAPHRRERLFILATDASRSGRPDRE